MGNDPTLEDVLGGLVEVAEDDDWEPSESGGLDVTDLNADFGHGIPKEE